INRLISNNRDGCPVQGSNTVNLVADTFVAGALHISRSLLNDDAGSTLGDIEVLGLASVQGEGDIFIVTNLFTGFRNRGQSANQLGGNSTIGIGVDVGLIESVNNLVVNYQSGISSLTAESEVELLVSNRVCAGTFDNLSDGDLALARLRLLDRLVSVRCGDNSVAIGR